MTAIAQDAINSSFGQAAIGAMLALAVKYAWDRWLSKTSRVTREECFEHQKLCATARNMNLIKALGLHDNKLADGEKEFVCIGTQLEKIRTILEAVLDINLKLCKVNTEIDCEELIRVLAKRGLEFNLPKRTPT